LIDACGGRVILLALPAIAAVPSIDDLPASGARAPNDVAVVIANEAYTGFGAVPYATRDADAFASWLVRVRGLPAVSVVRVGDASKKAIEDAVTRVAASVPAGGTLWVYYAGHGVGLQLAGDRPERVLLGINAIARAEEIADYAVPVSRIEQIAASSAAARSVVVLDACFNNAGRDGSVLVPGRFAVPVAKLPAPDRVTVWTATDAQETAIAYEPARHGAFTFFAIGALSGWADGVSGPADGNVTLDEAQAWVSRALPSVGILGQRPQIAGPGFVVSSGRLSAPPDALPPAASSRDDYIARYTALRAEEARLAAEHTARVAARQAAIDAEADAEWSRIEPLLGGEGALAVVETFLSRWRDRDEVVDGQRTTFPVAAVGRAEAARTKLGRFASRTTGYTMTRIEPGQLTMGSFVGEAGRSAENEAPHAVRITRPFLIGVTEVTQGQWRNVAASNPSEADFVGISLLGDKLPVQNLDWCDAVWFANALSRNDGFTPVYGGVDQCEATAGESVTWSRKAEGYRLPTEAEWEYAARAGGHTAWVGGDDASGVCADGNVADASARDEWGNWEQTATCDDGIVGLAPVGRYRPNAWGLYDVLGNVLEWVWDRPQLALPDATDPTGASTGTSRVFRGGAWHAPPSDARIAQRSWNVATTRGQGLGLRLARNIP
jgi:sulfatase modifying factor 1